MQLTTLNNEESFNSLSESDIKKINATICKFPENTQFSVAKITNGQVSYYGALKLDKAAKPIDCADAVFEIGSISKVITSAMLAQLSIDKKLSLNDDISEYLDININQKALINFTQLANHSSGLPRLPPGLLWGSLFKDRANPYKNFDEPKLIDYLQNKLKQKKTGKYKYSNLAVGTLGYILSKILKTNYETALQQLVCSPLCLGSTTTNRSSILEKLVQGRNKKGEAKPCWDLNALAGAGGIYSNVSDLAKFVLANFDQNNGALQLQHKPTLKLHKDVSVGLGWHLINSKETGNASWSYHNGATGGFCSEMIIDPANKNAVILLTNVSGEFLLKAGKLQKIVFELMKSE